MPNTTNFNWTTPADTDLVKDGALAIRTLANGIDTSLVDLKGGTTGQVLAKATNTDLDFSWVAADDTNAIQNAIIDAKGDLIVGTAADTPARLAIGGTNGHVLMVDSAETSGMKWAAVPSGGMTLLETLTLSGASVTSSTISGAYVDLVIYVENFKPTTDDRNLQMRVNGDSNARYSSTNFNSNSSNQTFGETEWNIALSQDNAAAEGLSVVNLYRYASTGIWKMGNSLMFGNNATTNTNFDFTTYKYAYNQTGAITSLFFRASSGNMTSGTVYIYGVK